VRRREEGRSEVKRTASGCVAGVSRARVAVVALVLVDAERFGAALLLAVNDNLALLAHVRKLPLAHICDVEWSWRVRR